MCTKSRSYDLTYFIENELKSKVKLKIYVVFLLHPKENVHSIFGVEFSFVPKTIAFSQRTQRKLHFFMSTTSAFDFDLQIASIFQWPILNSSFNQIRRHLESQSNRLHFFSIGQTFFLSDFSFALNEEKQNGSMFYFNQFIHWNQMFSGTIQAFSSRFSSIFVQFFNFFSVLT